MFGTKIKRAVSMTYIVVLSTLLPAKSKLMAISEWKASHPLPCPLNKEIEYQYA